MARKILLADDSVTAQNMGRKILADAGYEVITVNNGSAALKKIAEQRPDLIVLDVYMPGYSGLEVCQRLKDAAETARIPILLTVGKLEPFKPEEAKKARADGFIVKPFEASELLSALSKLEDKVVPRGETSKTGRFARASAATEDSRFDKSVGVEHDSSWKTRIVFPKKHKEEAAEPEAAAPAVSKDLRTTAEPKAAAPAPAAPVQPAPVQSGPVQPVAPTEEERVDLGALAPAGLPKDVTPEEIAALAAAAAQMKGKIAHETAEPQIEMPVVAPVEPEAAKPEVKAEAPVAEPVPVAEPEVAAPAVPAATFAEQAAESTEKIEEKDAEVPASPAAVSAAIAGLEAEAAQARPADSGSGSGSPSTPVKAEEPVTMAVAAAAAATAGPAGPRWTAVAVTLAPEEAGISLEQEMQRMYSAYAAAESDRTAIFRLPEIPMPKAAVEAPTAEPAPVQALVPVQAEVPVVAEPAPAAIPTPAEVAPEAAETMSAVASAATDAISAAVAELESVAASYAAERFSSVPEKTEEIPHASPEPTIEEKAPVSEAKAEQAPAVEATPGQDAEVESAKAEATNQTFEPEPEPAKAEEPQAVSEPVEAKIEEQVKREEPAEEEVKEAAAVAEAPVAAAVEVPQEQASDREISEEPAAPARASVKAGGVEDMAKQETETAAAWASWRKIRETGGSKPAAESSSRESDETSEPKDAAMAVAVGAEHSPEDVASLDADPEIASIVDSVLADMRPKIVEEIARKLGKKK